jgi:carbon monoxide dehydrogenase subunit G
VQLKHSFVLPAGVEETWAHFQDISGVAECFPGAKVTSAEGDDFQGTAKVKLGPVALQYSGSGSFIERDETARRMVFEAKGRDKRGNGTAGATVVLQFSEDPAGTRAEVETDLSVTGKPAQFGARMMQEVSDKLLGQFVDCLQQQVGGGGAESSPVETSETAEVPASGPTPAAGAESTTPSLVPRSGGPGPSTTAPPPSTPSPSELASDSPGMSTGGAAAPAASMGSGSDDALDLGATVLPVIARMYGKQVGAALVALFLLRWLWGRRG